MSYRELLDPKGAAKAKAKKRPSSYGPQQFRKPKSQAIEPAAPLVKTPKFDPKLLLNPKAAVAQTKTPSTSKSPASRIMEDPAYHTEQAGEREQSGGMGSFLERMHNVKQRDTTTQPKKRKVESVNDSDEADEDDPEKKQKSTFGSGRAGGIISEGMKAEREKYAAEAKSMPTIDLTNDEDEDDDVVIISEKSRDNSNEEVCLGRLHAKAHAFRIPASPRYRQAAQGREIWPMDRINFKRLAAHNNIIDLYDRSATDVNMGSKFANLEVKAAAALCPLLDGNSVNKFRIKIFVDVHPKKPGEQPGMPMSKLIPLSIILYAPRKFQQAIGRHLSQKQIFLSEPHTVDPGVEIDNPHNPKIFGKPSDPARKIQAAQANIVTRTQEEMSRDAQNMFDSLTKSEDLPEMEIDGKIIRTDLMSHQKQALSFLTQHESLTSSSNDKDFSLWKPRTSNKGKDVWMNIITGHEVEKPPPPVRGGILADMMGLGKTLSILALIAATMEEARKFGKEEAPLELENVERNAKTTLIICPKSVMTNWQTQIQEHAHPGKLKVYAYHGPSRKQDVDELANYDIILSSYNTAQAEFGDRTRRRKALASIQWFRIVLDEGHQIRNSATGISKACCALLAQRRWAVTGTPVQNRLDDLGALIRFLRIKPFDEDQNWTQYIISPFRAGNENVLPRLRLLVDSITLRRLKDRIGLTERDEKLVRLDFTDDEVVAYSQFARQANEKLRIMTGDNNKLQGKSYAHVLRALGRLRMICAHGKEMLSEDDQRELEGLTMSTAIDLGDEPDGEPDDSFVSSKHAYETFHMMSETEANICTGCGEKVGQQALETAPEAAEESESDENPTTDDDDNANDPETEDNIVGYLNPCYHLFCNACKDNYVNEALPNLTADGYHQCMYCEQYIRFGLFEILRSELKRTIEARNEASLEKGKRAKWNELSYSGPHTKVKALLQDLQESAQETASLPAGEPPIRSVVFSGWTQYLDLIEYALDKQGFHSLRLDGSMSVKARAEVLQSFATDPKITILLVSIKAGGQGLNFTAANKVYMMEPQFNPGVEQQAIDRVHRLGQTRHVYITHYVMRSSVEESILKLQDKKKDLARLTMEKKMSKAEEAKKRIEELKQLFK